MVAKGQWGEETWVRNVKGNKLNDRVIGLHGGRCVLESAW